MARMTKQNTNRRRQGMPSKEQILEFIQTSDTPAGKREIAKAFGLKGQEKITLKKRLKDMAEEGLIDGKRTAYHRMGGVPKVTVLKIVAIEDGEPIAEPENWAPDSKEKPPRLLVKESKKLSAVKRGDRILARNEETARGWVAHPMKKLPARTEGLMGVVEFDGAGKPWLAPVDKRVRDSAPIGDLGEAQEGELVLAERMGKSARAKVKVVEVVGDPLAPKAFSLIAIAKHGIPHVFPQETIAEAERAVDLPLSSDHREDLRDVPIVAIDPADARDHDDAIWAEPDGKGGYRAIIAIADVSYYVRPGGELDREARKRGNSVYFP
ncbi:MAG TPA: ribonuclease R, partial [Erythrobacter sp.]|nr:ribonuclease R [Erythrobacter sp.]